MSKQLKKYKEFLENLRQDDIWNIIPNSIKELSALFSKNNKSLYLVGGSVRDFLLGKTPHDFDLATDATSDEIISILGNNYRIDMHGKAFNVVVVYTKDCPDGIEIATFREDIYGDLLGKTRNPDVVVSDIEGDVKRRDLTFNALFYDLQNRRIVDLVGGIEDINNKVVKFVGDPKTRIMEDPLRILRLVRFANRYSFTIDTISKNAIMSNIDTLDIIVQERIWEEFKKGFYQANDKGKFIDDVFNFGINRFVFRELETKNMSIYSDNIIVMLSLLLFDNDYKNISNILTQLSKIEIEISSKVQFLLSLSDFSPEFVLDFYRKKISTHTENNIIFEFNKLKLNSKLVFNFLKFKPSVDAQYLMSIGIKGKELGDKIKELETINFNKL